MKKKSEWIELVRQYTPSSVDAEGVAMDLAQWLEVELEEDEPEAKLTPADVSTLWGLAWEARVTPYQTPPKWRSISPITREMAVEVANEAFNMGREHEVGVALLNQAPRVIEWDDRARVASLAPSAVIQAPGLLTMQLGYDGKWYGAGFNADNVFNGELHANEVYYPLTVLYVPEEK